MRVSHAMCRSYFSRVEQSVLRLVRAQPGVNKLVVCGCELTCSVAAGGLCCDNSYLVHKAALGLASLGEEVAGPAIPPERIFEAANVILSYQNHDGGWATYENTRSFHAFEVTTKQCVESECCCMICVTSTAIWRVPNSQMQSDGYTDRIAHLDLLLEVKLLHDPA